ncbi:toxin-antitoxin system YwqK family antitoxin [Flavobacterium faecale]|uniref:toxin-antitoxin system YwqK family antitoxin n=1 Tax=Flavobacterium faecale TaxID=1355330 RepID=UPI003AAB417D
MNIFKNLILFLLIVTSTFAQKSPKFDDLIEVNDNGIVKFYLSSFCKLERKSCAEYYLKTKFDKQYFQFQDTVNVYYKNDKLYIKGNYEKGLRHGEFIWFYDTGIVQTKGHYLYGDKSGIWEFYFPNGNLHKKIEYKNNVEHLIVLFDKKGKELVKDGNGFFSNEVLLSISNNSYSKLKGEVVNGLPNGKWEISLSGSNIGTEYFENNVFVRGISHSEVLGDTEYKDKSLVSFAGRNNIERLRLYGPSSCGNNYGMTPNASYKNKLKMLFDNSELKNSISNAWFLAGIKSDYSGNIVDVEMCSNAEQNIVDKFKKMILEVNMGKVKLFNLTPKGKFGYLFAPIVVLNNELHFTSDETIELLKYRY